MKHSKFSAVALALLFQIVASIETLAADLPFPSSGRVYNTVESGWLSYDCSAPQNGLLTCTFVQTGVRQQLKPDDARKRLSKETAGLEASLAKEYKSTPGRMFDSPEWKELCAMSSDVTRALRGEKTANAPTAMMQSLEKMGAREKQDMLRWSEAVARSCTTRTLDGMKDALSQSLDQEQRTCLIRTNPFSQTFKPQFSNGVFQSWIIADSTPAGECGLINVSRLVPGKESWQWRYYARKVVTNPSANVLLMSCSDLDQAEYLYDASPQPIHLQCDYIKPDF